LNSVDFVFRKATLDDIPFLVETIVEAEKAGTEIFPYTTIFGLTETEAKKYLTAMLLEEIDHCELSVSSFMVAEINGKLAAAVGAWIEANDGIPSSILKGNLLNYTLPKSRIEKARDISVLLRELHIDSLPGTIQIGVAYVSQDFRGINLAGRLIDKQLNRLLAVEPRLEYMYVQVFGSNEAAVRAYEKVHFTTILVKESTSGSIEKYLPSARKFLMQRKIKNQ
jgi:ribosomal protein S18 acetylase RimI-like enzyme